jgi:hypothetical protein
MLHKGYNSKVSVERNADHESQEVCREDGLIGGKLPLIK